MAVMVHFLQGQGDLLEMILQVNDDFDLNKIADSGQCFRWEKMDENTYRIIAGGFCTYIKDLGENRYDIDCAGTCEEEFWKNYFDLQVNYRHIRENIDQDQDPFLWEAADAQKGTRILRQDPWEMLITFIISQNKNIPAIRKSVNMLAESCGEKRLDGRGHVYYAFPEQEALAALPEECLKECKLGYRCKYVKAAAEAVTQGNINLEELIDADEEETIKALTSLYGVGVKVANCISLFGLHHLDAFPIDVWVKRILEEKYPDGYPFERYAPYNGVCQQFMFEYYRKIQ